jgi:teichuronic acid biosynthesis glycosyltransferase TuaC
LKILHIAPVNSMGELPTFLQHQINSLNEFTESDLLPFRGSNLTKGHPIEALKAVFKFWRVVRNSEADVIHAHWGSILGFLTAFTKRRQSLMVLTLRGSDVNKSKDENSMIHHARRTLTKFAIHRSDYKIFVSDQLKCAVNPVSTNVRVIPDGISLDIFRPISKNKAREILGWDQNSTYVVFHCGQRPLSKNIKLATQTIDKVKLYYPLLQFIVFENDLSQQELSLRFAAADALLFTSHAEGSPNVIREAIACGCPVVSVNVGDAKIWIEASDAGAICHYDSTELSNSLYNVINRKQRANHKVALGYSTTSVAESIVGIYSELKGRNN